MARHAKAFYPAEDAGVAANGRSAPDRWVRGDGQVVLSDNHDHDTDRRTSNTWTVRRVGGLTAATRELSLADAKQLGKALL